MSVISSLQKLKVELKRVSGRSASSFVCGSTVVYMGLFVGQMAIWRLAVVSAHQVTAPSTRPKRNAWNAKMDSVLLCGLLIHVHFRSRSRRSSSCQSISVEKKSAELIAFVIYSL
jgi:hypothetical protein